MKKNAPIVVVGLLVVLALLLYMVTFEVRFNHTAVLTTFGKAGAGAVKNVAGDAAGLYFKWPWPIQSVIVYDGRDRALEDRPEEQSTRDKQNLIVNAYVAWRIAEPLAFYRNLADVSAAERQLRSRLREAKSIISRYDFDQLTNPDPEQLKLREAEEAILQRLRADVAAKDYGIEVKAVGIVQLLLPESVTGEVIKRMRGTRQRLAEEARSEGRAIAAKIKSEADTARDTILSFAERRAQAIRGEGDAAAARYYETFRKDPDFAIFLRQLDALEETLKHNTTFLLDTKIAPFHLMKEEGGGERRSGTGPNGAAGGNKTARTR